MEEDKRLQAAGALVAIIGLVLLVVQFAGNRPASKASGGPGWYSRMNPFGSAPSADPAPASAAPALAPPERMMTNAATRLFSSPTSDGTRGGLAGAEPPPTPPDEPNAPMNSPRISGNASMGYPGGGGGRAPTAGGSASFGSAPGGGERPSAPARGGSGSSGLAGSGGGGGGGGSGAGSSPGGETKAAATGASGFGGAMGASAAAGMTPGSRQNPLGANGATPPQGGGLNDLSSTSGAGGGGGGGGGLGGGGGGGGGGGAGGMGGGVPGGKPKESAGKPAGVDAGANSPKPAGAAGGATGTGGTDGSEGSSGSPEKAAGIAGSVQTAMIGVPDVGDGVPSGKKFVLKSGLEIQTQLYKKNGQTLIGFTAPMAIDGKSADGGVAPFIVVSKDFLAKHPEVKPRDYATVTYGVKTLYGIVISAEDGQRLGVASPATASGFALDTDPVNGGMKSASVQYLVAPGSGGKFPAPRKTAEIQSNGRSVFDALGAKLK